jgi:hypothetical protein
MKTAADFLREAAQVIEERGKLRDKEDGERAMSRAVAAYNALCGPSMEGELEGWLFLCLLKLARATAGSPHLDDYTDLAGYAALAAECVSKAVEIKDRKQALNELVKESEELGLYSSHPDREESVQKGQEEREIVPNGNSGWIPWCGWPSDCPVDVHTNVSVRFRDGTICSTRAYVWDWKWYTGESDSEIIAYRVIKQGG